MKKIILILSILAISFSLFACGAPAVEPISEEIAKEAEALEVKGLVEVNIQEVEELGSQMFIKCMVLNAGEENQGKITVGEVASFPVMVDATISLLDGSSVTFEEFSKNIDSSKVYNLNIVENAVTGVSEK